MLVYLILSGLFVWIRNGERSTPFVRSTQRIKPNGNRLFMCNKSHSSCWDWEARTTVACSALSYCKKTVTTMLHRITICHIILCIKYINAFKTPSFMRLNWNRSGNWKWNGTADVPGWTWSTKIDDCIANLGKSMIYPFLKFFFSKQAYFI